MTHTKFIELLNLYVDHQISAEEAGLLEAEIQQNPARRELYLQYCRMQKGCTLLAETFRDHAPTPAWAEVHEFPHSRRRALAWTSGLGTLAAAACVALVLMNRAPAPADNAANQPVKAPALAQNDTPAPMAQPMLTLPAMEQSHQRLQTVFTSAPVMTNALSPDQANMTLTAQDLARFDWMNHVQVEPVQLDNYSFQVRPATDTELNRTYRSHKQFQGNAQMISFEFQR